MITTKAVLIIKNKQNNQTKKQPTAQYWKSYQLDRQH